MDECPSILASTGAEAFFPLLIGAVLLVAGAVTLAAVKRRTKLGGVACGVLLLAVAFAVVPAGAISASAAEECPPAAAQPPPVPPAAPAPSATPTPTPSPEPCVPSVTLAPPAAPKYWVGVASADGTYTFTVTPDAAWSILADAAGAVLAFTHSWTVTGYVYATDVGGEFVADTSATPWTITGTGTGSTFTVDTASAIAAQTAEIQAAHPEAVEFFPIPLVMGDRPRRHCPSRSSPAVAEEATTEDSGWPVACARPV